jgi:DNA-binding NtrC family response regulator
VAKKPEHGVSANMFTPEHVTLSDTAVLESVVLDAAHRSALTLLVFGGAAHRLNRTLTVGRATACDVMLADLAASRVHAQLTPAGAAVEIVDFESRNGTFLNGKRITRALAQAGSLLRIGDTLLRIASLFEAWEAPISEGPLVGGCALAPVRRLISLVAPTELPVLILGETGTGKEIVAHLVHAASARPGPLVAVNCAALPESLADSELFGHARGAFTGAARAHKGLFAAASEGTLFLDEVGELPLPTQAKLLRVLEDGMVRAVGSEDARKVDVRIVSATNRDLSEAVARGSFRADLRARLSAIELHTPPLRDRPEDLPSLCAYLLRRFGSASPKLSPNTWEAMALYEWPENVRELDNVLRQLAVGAAREIDVADLPERVRQRLALARAEPAAPPAATPPAPSPADLRGRLEDALKAHAGNVRRASQTLGISRPHAYRLMRRWNIDLERFRRPPGHEVC